jgi:hypothetical protein
MKKLFPFLLFLFTVVSLGLLSYFQHKNQPAIHWNHYHQFSSDAEEQKFVEKWYASTNDVYFDNQLPKDTIIQIHVIPPDVNADFTIGETTALGNGQYIIQIDPRFNLSANQEAGTLLHEECHIYLMQQNGDPDPKHKERFQSCMKNLAEGGAFYDVW